MCLIAVSTDGKEITRETFDLADLSNPDGIGVMTAEGFAKFLGPKQRRKAWRYLDRHVFRHGLPYAVHWRWTTHGGNTRANTHPHLTPDGRWLVMHNGVMAEYDDPTGERSDTSLFTEEYLFDVPDPTDSQAWNAFVLDTETHIGTGNKLAMLHIASGSFHILNKRMGDTGTDGIWYSNTYSLPDAIDPYSRVNTRSWRRHPYDGGYGLGDDVPLGRKYRVADTLDRWLSRNRYRTAPGDDGLARNYGEYPELKESDDYDVGYTPERVRREEQEAAEALDSCYLYARR